MIQQEIEDLILVSDGFLLELGEDMLIEERRGCLECCDAGEIMQIIVLKEQLIYKISIGDYGTETGALYSCLLSAVANYSGASIMVDPNASVPNTTIDVTITGNDSPYELMFGWDEFIDNGLAGRVRYENPAWAGWVPIIQIGNVSLNYGLASQGIPDDMIILPTGGFELLSGGNVPEVYSGQMIKSEGYYPYVVPLGTALIQNNSTYAIQYNDNGAGLVSLFPSTNYYKNPIISNQSMVIQLPIPASGEVITLTYKQYDVSGNVVLTLPISRPPSNGNLNVTNMSISLRHEFIITSI